MCVVVIEYFCLPAPLPPRFRHIRDSMEQREANGLRIEFKGGVDMVTEIDKVVVVKGIYRLRKGFSLSSI